MTESLKGSVRCSMHCCSVEAVPHAPGGGLFALGMYELNENTNVRNGAVALCDREALVFSRTMASGVLDMKFHDSLLACAMSSGDIELLSLDEELSTLSPKPGGVSFHEEGLALSVDWAKCNGSNGSNGNSTKLAVSTQQGSVLVYELLPTGLQECSTLQHVHSLFGENIPAWIVAFNPHNPNVLVSGGDDCCLKLWDLRCSDTPIYNMSKFFTAGVTSSQWCPYGTQEHIYAAGSYDGSIALWDDRMLRNSPLASVDSGGGVWRLKWMPERLLDESTASLYLGAASMHSGSGIYEIKIGNCGSDHADLLIEVVDIQKDCNEERLVYGMDWLNGKGGTITKTNNDCTSNKKLLFEIATCSFYDNLIQIWGNC